MYEAVVDQTGQFKYLTLKYYCDLDLKTSQLVYVHDMPYLKAIHGCDLDLCG